MSFKTSGIQGENKRKAFHITGSHTLIPGNIDFEDFRFGFEDWPKHKPSTPFGSVPVLQWDGEELAQTMAIVKFVARKVGMAGKSDLEFAQAGEPTAINDVCIILWNLNPLPTMQYDLIICIDKAHNLS